jgi:head-tail adaptor
MTVRAGRLEHKVGIYKVVTTYDESNTPVKSYELKKYAWANVRANTAQEKMKHGREEMATVVYTLEMRYDSTLHVTDQIKFNNYMMDIQSIAPRGRLNRENMQVHCEVIDVNSVVGE